MKKFLNKKLGELLIESDVINQSQLAEALEIQEEKGGLIGEILVQLKYTTEEDIAKTLTAQYGFAYLPLSNYEIDHELIRLIPERVARQYCLIPIDKIAQNLTIAMSNPLNSQATEDIETLSGCSVQVFVSTSSDIRQAIEKYYKVSN
jgi:type IV pilus assembly protein PilB